MKNKSKSNFVVFLDVDGVLNTEKTCIHTPEGYTGVDEARVEILANSMKNTGADGVVLTSTWKIMREDEADYIYLMEKFDKYGIKMLGKTTEERLSEREDGILKYLEMHPEIEEYVILDDQHYGFKYHNKLWESFIDTHGEGIENSSTASNTPSVPAILFLEAIKKYAKD